VSPAILQSRDRDVVTVTISNPAKLNALTVAMWRALKACFDALSAEADLRCIVIRGAGAKAFSAGADISEFESTRATYPQVVDFHENDVLGGLSAVSDCPVPVVAAIRGACFGGGVEIASACDIRLAAASAQFGVPVGRLGFPLTFAETQALFRLAGPTATAELLLEGRIYAAHEAYQKGLVTRVVEDAEFEAALRACTDNIRASGIAAARSHKRQLRRLMRDPSPVSREERLREYGFAETEEYRQGYRAFLEKTRPRRRP
jgi:enoyl-CoA hydratase/carnithine racemase